MLTANQLAVLDLSIALTLKHQRHTLEPSQFLDLVEAKIEVEAELLRRHHAHNTTIRT